MLRRQSKPRAFRSRDQRSLCTLPKGPAKPAMIFRVAFSKPKAKSPNHCHVVPTAASKSTVDSSNLQTDLTRRPRPSALAIALYVPNLVCYGRLVLLAAAALVAASRPAAAVSLILLNFILDGVDGAVARRLGQTSAFGSFLDVAVDLASRGLVWSWAAPGGFGAAVLLLESLTFVCTHAASGPAWKDPLHFSTAPRWARSVMANGFRTPPGCWAVAGLMGCPLWMWAHRVMPGSPWSSPLLGAVLVSGRLLAAAVEVWVVGRHLGMLLTRDAQAAAERAAAAAAGEVAAAAAAADANAGSGQAAMGGVVECPAGPSEEEGPDGGVR
ncbi:hypothetical protein PLESTB_001390200 [Pleodorina starrii]|uniref:CDP-diacylglycerol--inositol 3-phosphatidyltransferase n=1 Tax=Pleodorina starrii TaxID=330485 RepID=A0A9W6BVF4_9CHLO|nr:hypothetical protein PLESTB_001390200 [Pleodorina starrii]